MSNAFVETAAGAEAGERIGDHSTPSPESTRLPVGPGEVSIDVRIESDQRIRDVRIGEFKISRVCRR
jgi:hypothetical protein